MEKNLKNIVLLIVAVLLMVGGVFYFMGGFSATNSVRLDDFAKCIKDKKAAFYGAFWCPHCQDQKKLFGASEQYIPYVECSTSDSNSQLQICKDQNIQVYPTWKFADGTSVEGQLSLQELADKTGCVLPK